MEKKNRTEEKRGFTEKDDVLNCNRGIRGSLIGCGLSLLLLIFFFLKYC